nr:unnamed protein product [Callosobruchus chinensis]CAH7753327.1 unnamed protein product [Callosobruchus chinensis]CAH7757932.1 unnamed protein product [Callosobruchus chinensis]
MLILGMMASMIL